MDQLPSLPNCFTGDIPVDGDQVDTGARKDIPSDILQRFNVHYPICIVPDGNCFCRSISHLVYGSICGSILRNHWWEIEADYLCKSFGGIPGGIKIEL